MERKIGETFEYEGKKLKVVETEITECKNCYFFNNHACIKNYQVAGECLSRKRTDYKPIVFIEVKNESKKQEQAEPQKLNLCEILKNCPKGWELYSPLFGTVTFNRIFRNSIDYGLLTIEVIDKRKKYWYFYAEGGKFVQLNKKYDDYDDDRVKDSFILSEECMLFPSKDQRNWSKFTAPWYYNKKFDYKTLKPFDKVIRRDSNIYSWQCDFFSYIRRSNGTILFYCINEEPYRQCIPYNDETKYLIGTAEEAPEYYRYWKG